MIYQGPLRFGLFLAPFHSVRLDPTYAFERDLLLAQHLDRLGFEELWFGEHHSGGFEMSATPELMIAAAAERTKYIRLCTGVKSLPFHHPLMVAETMAQLDHMTRGRTIFGVGPGALASDAHMLGIEVAELRPRMEQSLAVIMALLAGETVTQRTDWFELREARLHVGCYTQPRMEMAVTSVRSPAGVVLAGHYGLGVLTLGSSDDAALAHHRANWEIHEAEAARHGHTPDRSKWRLTVPMHIAETREKALADTSWGFREYLGYAHDILPAPYPIPRDTKDPARFAVDHQIAIIGSPDDAIAEIERIQGALGGFGALLVMGMDFAPWPANLRSYELIAEIVKPHFSGRNALRQASYDRHAAEHEGNLVKTMDAVSQATDAYRLQHPPKDT